MWHFSWFLKCNHLLEPRTSQLSCTAFPGFKDRLHCSELVFTRALLFFDFHSFFLSPPFFLFFVFVSVNQLVSLSVTSFYSAHMYGTHIHIAQIPLGKLLSLPMNSAMLLLSLDPKGNIMNNEQSSERSGWGSRMRRWAAWEGERGPSGPGHDGETEGRGATC